jgi:hypothetical protein
MRFKIVTLLLISILLARFAGAQVKNTYAQPRILILLDESSSMLQRWSGGKEKHKVANDIILKLMDSVWSFNENVEFSLRVFGSQSTVPEHNCTDTRNEVPFRKQNRTQMEFRLEDIQPLGITSIAYALSEAAEKDLIDEEHNAYSIVLLTDGGESCNGDICAVMQKLSRNKVFFKPYILSLEDVPELKSVYACMGNYLPVTKKSDISPAVGAIVESFRPMLNLTKEDYKIIQKVGIPSVMKVSLPPIKVEKKVDTLPRKPTPTEPVKAKADTPKKEEKKSSIKVDEVVNLPPPLKMVKPKFARQQKLFVRQPSGKAVYAHVPALILPEPELPPVLPPPLNMAKVKYPAPRRLAVKLPAYKPMYAREPKLNLPEPELPPVLPVPLKMKPIAMAPMRKLPVSMPKVKKFKPIPVAYEINVTVPEPEFVKPEPLRLTAIKPTAVKKKKVSMPAYHPVAYAATAPVIKLPEPEPVAIVTPPVKPPVAVTPPVKAVEPPKTAPEKTGRITGMPKPRFSRIRKRTLIYLPGKFFDTPTLVAVPPPPKFKPIQLAAVTPAVVTPPKPKMPNPAVNTAEYSVTQEENRETALLVYITDGKGKYFPVNPKIIITDAVTGKEVKKFTRFVDATGNPDPIKDIKPGKYLLTIEGRNDLVASVDMLPNKHTRVEIIAKKYSLSFYYIGNEKRPVNEFVAQVTQRNTNNGKVANQRCSDKKEYEEGNYHIVINTFPEDIRNIDLTSGFEGAIGIQQPGTVKFVVTARTKKVILQRQQGDKYMPFFSLNLDELPGNQIAMQPGKYQAVYNNGVTKFSASDRVVPFTVVSNKETDLQIEE